MKLLSVIFVVCCISAAYAEGTYEKELHKNLCSFCKRSSPFLVFLAKQKCFPKLACICYHILKMNDKLCTTTSTEDIQDPCNFDKDNNNVNNGGNDGVNNGDKNVPTNDGNNANNNGGNENANSNDNIGNNSKEKNNEGPTVENGAEAGQAAGFDPEDEQTNIEKPIEEGNTKSRQHALKTKHHASKSKLHNKHKANKKHKEVPKHQNKTHSKNKNHNNKSKTNKQSHKEKA